jgi:hypothetical protein
MTHHFSTSHPISEERTRELLDDLEESSHIGVRQAREISAVATKAAIEVRAGDVCSRRSILAQGTTTELQRHGVSCVLAEPVLTGSVFYLVFDRQALDLAPELGVCDRSTMLSDTAFDTHFRFTRAIDLPDDASGT